MDQIQCFVKLIKNNHHHFESQAVRTLDKMDYPKYEMTPKILGLQLKDAVFAETFLYQVLIMIDCLLHPIKDQEKKI